MKLSIVALAAAVFNRACVLPAAAAEVAAAYGFEKKVPSMAEPLRAENEDLRNENEHPWEHFAPARKCSLDTDWFACYWFAYYSRVIFVVLYVYFDYLLGLFLDFLDGVIVATLTALLGVFVINYFSPAIISSSCPRLTASLSRPWPRGREPRAPRAPRRRELEAPRAAVSCRDTPSRPSPRAAAPARGVSQRQRNW